MHGAYDVQLGEALVADLAVHDDVGNNANDLSTGGEGGVGDDSHEADGGSSVEQAVAAFGNGGAEFVGGGEALLVLRPLSMISHNILVNQIVNPGLSNMIRWQNHWHVVRQSWTFFQNDFAGRIANRVLQTGPALRESLVVAFDAAAAPT